MRIKVFLLSLFLSVGIISAEDSGDKVTGTKNKLVKISLVFLLCLD